MITPSSLVVETGQEAVFRCRHNSADSISWLVNDSFVGRNPPDGIAPGITMVNNLIVDTLTIHALSEFNKTKVVCEATFRETTTSNTTSPVLLLIQGLNLQLKDM